MPMRFSCASDKGSTELISQLKRSALYLTASLTIVAAIVATAMYWVHISHTRPLPEGRVLRPLWGTHGIHSLDLVVLVVEALLVALLCVVLLAGFSRRT